MSSSSPFSSTAYVPSFMLRGGVLTKYHESNSSSDKRTFFYSGDRLYWCKAGKKLVQELDKSIAVRAIGSIYVGKPDEITEVWSKGKAKKANENRCLTIVVSAFASEKERILCLEAESEKERNEWIDGLIRLFYVHQSDEERKSNKAGPATNWDSKAEWEKIKKEASAQKAKEEEKTERPILLTPVTAEVKHDHHNAPASPAPAQASPAPQPATPAPAQAASPAPAAAAVASPVVAAAVTPVKSKFAFPKVRRSSTELKESKEPSTPLAAPSAAEDSSLRTISLTSDSTATEDERRSLTAGYSPDFHNHLNDPHDFSRENSVARKKTIEDERVVNYAQPAIPESPNRENAEAAEQQAPVVSQPAQQPEKPAPVAAEPPPPSVGPMATAAAVVAIAAAMAAAAAPEEPVQQKENEIDEQKYATPKIAVSVVAEENQQSKTPLAGTPKAADTPVAAATPAQIPTPSPAPVVQAVVIQETPAPAPVPAPVSTLAPVSVTLSVEPPVTPANRAPADSVYSPASPMPSNGGLSSPSISSTPSARRVASNPKFTCNHQSTIDLLQQKLFEVQSESQQLRGEKHALQLSVTHAESSLAARDISHRELQSQLRDSQILLHATETKYSRAQEEFAARENSLMTKNNEAAALSRRLQQELDETRTALDTAKAAIASSQSRLLEVESRVEASSNVSNMQLASLRASLEARIEQLRSDLSASESLCGEFRSTNANLVDQVAVQAEQARIAEKTYTTAIENLTSEKNSALTDATEWKTRAQSLQAQQAALELKWATQETELSHTRTRLKQLENLWIQQSESLRNSQSKSNHSSLEFSTLSGELAQLKVTNSSLQGQWNESQGRIDGLQRKQLQLESEIISRDEKITELAGLAQELEGKLEESLDRLQELEEERRLTQIQANERKRRLGDQKAKQRHYLQEIAEFTANLLEYQRECDVEEAKEEAMKGQSRTNSPK